MNVLFTLYYACIYCLFCWLQRARDNFVLKKQLYSSTERTFTWFFFAELYFYCRMFNLFCIRFLFLASILPISRCDARRMCVILSVVLFRSFVVLVILSWFGHFNALTCSCSFSCSSSRGCGVLTKSLSSISANYFVGYRRDRFHTSWVRPNLRRVLLDSVSIVKRCRHLACYTERAEGLATKTGGQQMRQQPLAVKIRTKNFRFSLNNEFSHSSCLITIGTLKQLHQRIETSQPRSISH